MTKNQIPKNWISCQLKDIGNIVSGGTPSTKNAAFWGDEVRWITPADLSGYSDKYISTGRKSLSLLGLQNSSAKLVPRGSILFSSRAPIGYVAIASNELATNQGFKNVVPFQGIDSSFVFYYLKSIKEVAVERARGTTFKEISGSAFAELPFFLPPLREQQRIVAKIEELFSELDAGVASLKTAQAQLKTYRQAVLKCAFEGKLTSDAVKKGELPSGWKLGVLGELSEMCLGKMLDRSKNKGEYQPYLRNINVRWGDFQLDDLEEMRFEPEESERYGIKRDDLIVCEGGEPGRCAIWHESQPNMKIQKALHRIRVNGDLNVRYLFHYLFYSAKSGLMEKYFTGTTIKHLTGRELKKIEFPLCSLKEQQRIVEEIESRLSVCDDVEKTIATRLTQAKSLRQSILKKAFEGQLA